MASYMFAIPEQEGKNDYVLEEDEKKKTKENKIKKNKEKKTRGFHY